MTDISLIDGPKAALPAANLARDRQVNILVPSGLSEASAAQVGFLNGFGRRAARNSRTDAFVARRSPVSNQVSRRLNVGSVAYALVLRRLKRSSNYRPKVLSWLAALFAGGLVFNLGYRSFDGGFVRVVAFLMGVCQGAPRPLFFEWVADLSYPLNEGTSAASVVAAWNLLAILGAATRALRCHFTLSVLKPDHMCVKEQAVTQRETLKRDEPPPHRERGDTSKDSGYTSSLC